MFLKNVLNLKLFYKDSLTKYFFLSLIFIFNSSCTQNSGVYDDRLLKLVDAETELRNLYIIKQLFLFPNSQVSFHFNLVTSVGCKRDIYFDKSDFRRCLSNLTVTPFGAKNNQELYFDFLNFVQNRCDLSKIIMFENSIWGGELNLCELN